MTTVPRQDRSRKSAAGNQETIWQETGKTTDKPENNLEGNQKKCGKTCRRAMREKD